MSVGMFQYGLNTTYVMRSDSTGVGLAFLPVTTFIASTLLPPSITSRRNAGMLTMTYREPRSSGNHRQRSMFMAICSTAAASPRLPVQRELVLQSLILLRLRRELLKRLLHLVLAERHLEPVVEIDVCRRDVPREDRRPRDRPCRASCPRRSAGRHRWRAGRGQSPSGGRRAETAHAASASSSSTW